MTLRHWRRPSCKNAHVHALHRPSGQPRSPDTAWTSRTARPHPRHRARPGKGALHRARPGAGADGGDGECRARSSGTIHPPAARDQPPRRGSQDRRGHGDVAGNLRGRPARRRRCGAGRRRGHVRAGDQRLRGHAPAGTPCRARPRHGVLLLQQRRHRRPPCPGEARCRARRDLRLGRASRQRHAGHLLVGRERALLLDPRGAALSGNRRDLGEGRARHHRQRAP